MVLGAKHWAGVEVREVLLLSKLCLMLPDFSAKPFKGSMTADGLCSRSFHSLFSALGLFFKKKLGQTSVYGL